MKPIRVGLFILISVVSPLLARDYLTPQPPVELTGTHGRFDFLKFDATQRRLLACHTENGSLDVIDGDSSKLIKSIPTGAAQGVAIDNKGGRYFVSVSQPPKLVIIDAAKLEVTGEVPLPSPSDLVAYEPQSDRVLVDNDEKPEMWVIDPAAKKIVQTNTLPAGGMEDLGLNPGSTFVFQALKDGNLLAKVDFVAGKIYAQWPTSPVEKPHGIALVDDQKAVLVAGGNGHLVLMDQASGTVMAATDIAQKVDEIAYDAGLKRVYCASGLGSISVVLVPGEKMVMRDTIPSPPGTHSITVDPKTHLVWIAYAKDDKAFVQAFSTDFQ